MRQALDQARLALEDGEFPVGCVLVCENAVIRRGRRRNSKGSGSNEIDHAEMVTLRALLADRPETDCRKITVYSTMEPCLMCYTTLLLSGVRRFVWAYEDIMGGGTDLLVQRPEELLGENVVFSSRRTDLRRVERGPARVQRLVVVARRHSAAGLSC